MPVNTTGSTVQYTGDGVQKVFPFTFPIGAEGDLVVKERVTATGVTALQVLTTHYTVTKSGTNFDNGGNVVMVTAPAATDTLIIARDTTQTQSTDLIYGDPHDSEAYEDMVDRNTLMIQELQKQVDRCLKIPDTDADGLGVEFDNSIDRALQYAGFDAAGKAIAAATFAAYGAATPYIQTLLDDANAATAAATLEVLKDIFTTQGDIVIEGAAGEERLAAAAAGNFLRAAGAGASPAWAKLALSDTGVHIGSNTRASAGSQVITGVGFKPSLVIFLAVDTDVDDLNWCVGFDNNAQQGSIYQYNDGLKVSSSGIFSIYITRDATNYLQAAISAIGTDGFSLTWAISNTCSVKFVYLCLP